MVAGAGFETCDLWVMSSTTGGRLKRLGVSLVVALTLLDGSRLIPVTLARLPRLAAFQAVSCPKRPLTARSPSLRAQGSGAVLLLVS